MHNGHQNFSIGVHNTYKSVKHRKKRVKIAKSQTAKGHKKQPKWYFLTLRKADVFSFSLSMGFFCKK